MGKCKKISAEGRPYAGSIAAVAATVAAGLVLQLTVGGIDYTWLRWPANIFAGLVLVLLISTLAINRHGLLFRWLSGLPLAVTLIAAITLLGIIMGLTPQADAGNLPEGTMARLGFTSMTTSWPFALLYAFILLSLGCATARRMIPPGKGDLAFYLNHLGLWLLLFSAGMGAADIERYKMQVPLGETQWRVQDAGRVTELPVAIHLNDFQIEQYPSKVAVARLSSGSFLPEGKPVYIEADSRAAARIFRWEIAVEKYLHHAVPACDTLYIEAVMPASSPAAYVRAVETNTGEVICGWISAGNSAQQGRILELDPDHALVMMPPEPKKYISDIDVSTLNGRKAHARLEVNKPLHIGHWTMYQYGYDTRAGRMSGYSVIELVYDPWIVPVYIGILMLAAGSVGLILSGAKAKRDRK
ncbi:MAG: cytochrome c biogenesis protein ResB [Rikenellaceae bacterium]|nr:cytochrome c biogenesis protein ResB [Rikenellaceae bacterium]